MKHRIRADGRAGSASTDSAPGAYLLVPMTVEAMVVSKLDQKGGDVLWSTDIASFARLKPKGEVGPLPFKTTSPPPETGVMLHWALPSAFTHGRQQPGAAGPIEFPLVPNRWFVMRAYTNAAGARKTRFWVVESDYVASGPNEKPKATPVSAAVLDKSANPATVKWIGRTYTWEQWQLRARELEQQARPPFLTAVGPGDPAFAAFYPNVRNIFGMQDDLQDLHQTQSGGNANLMYHVAGWVSSPEADLLHRARIEPETFWDRLKAEFEWEVDGARDRGAGAGSSAHPDRILCHGMVYSVPWFGPDGPPKEGPRPHPDQRPRWRARQYTQGQTLAPKRAIGNTLAEALAALIAHDTAGKNAEFEKQLLTIQYGLASKLDGPDGEAELERGLHAAAFASTPGGSRWAATPAPTDEDETPRAGEPPPLPAGLAKRIADLNAYQQALDALGREQRSRRQHLYDLWHRSESGDEQDAARYTARIATLRRNIEDRAAHLQATATAFAETKAAIEAELAAPAGTPRLELKEEAMPRFFRPADPVVLLSGAGRSPKHDPAGESRKSDSRRCRLADQTVRALNARLSEQGAQVRISRELFAGLLPTASPGIPAEVEALSLEALLFDAEAAEWIAGAARPDLNAAQRKAFAAEIAAAQAARWSDGGPPKPETGLEGVIPEVLALAYWQCPWSPLFLDWSLNWMPAGASPEACAAPYTLGAVDYPLRSPQGETPQTLEGRAVLSPDVTGSVRQKLKEIRAGAPLWVDGKDRAQFLENLDRVIDAIGRWDLVAQTLSGLTDRFLQVDADWIPLPPADLLGVMGKQPISRPSPGLTYLPVRAGGFMAEKLWVVDSFGQAASSIQMAELIRSERVWSGDRKDPRALFPPRLCQAARLLCRMVDANDENIDVALHPNRSAICGWIVVNYLDGGINVFDAAGKLLGELYLSGDVAGDVIWEIDPRMVDRDARSDRFAHVADTHLRRFLKGVLDAPERGAALAGLMDAIDAAAWGASPSAPEKGSENIAALIGKPLALVRARLQLELEGDPICRQPGPADAADASEILGSPWNGAPGKPELGRSLAQGLLETPFTVRLGAPKSPKDGLIGFFADEDVVDGRYRRMRVSPPLPVPPRPDSDRFIDPVCEIALTAGERPGKLLTLLMHPYSSVMLTSGLLPAGRAAMPPVGVEAALAAMEITFRIGPILTKTPADPRTPPAMPLPVRVKGEWRWIAPDGPLPTPIPLADDRARVTEEAIELIEGWLKLSGSQKK